jgi:hypothetical protein
MCLNNRLQVLCVSSLNTVLGKHMVGIRTLPFPAANDLQLRSVWCSVQIHLIRVSALHTAASPCIVRIAVAMFMSVCQYCASNRFADV